MSQRQILQVFEQYQSARVNFVQVVSDLANRPTNVETLQSAGVMQLLRPLLLDVVPTVQQTAALALVTSLPLDDLGQRIRWTAHN